jgi:hypothetical protein
VGWPLSQDYNEAVQSPRTSFGDPELRQGAPALGPVGLPLPRSGNFADVYEVACPGGAKWAVKCFTRRVADQGERYAEISRHLRDARLPFTVDFQYLAEGVRVRGRWYPVLKMRWVEGLLLNEFVRANVTKPALLEALSQIWVRMARRLREARVAHGDLQHGNVLLVPGSAANALALKLVDYDGLFVPALAWKSADEDGHANFQHPGRAGERAYNLKVDRFSLLLVATALRALIVGGRSLWERYDNGDNLLFKEGDLRAPAASALFDELRRLPDMQVQALVGRLHCACEGRLEDTPYLGDLVPEEGFPPLPAQAEPAAGAPAAAEPAPEAAPGDAGPEETPVAKRPRGGLPPWAWAVAAGTAVVLAGLFTVVGFGLYLEGNAPRPTGSAPALRRPWDRAPERRPKADPEGPAPTPPPGPPATEDKPGPTLPKLIPPKRSDL